MHPDPERDVHADLAPQPSSFPQFTLARLGWRPAFAAAFDAARDALRGELTALAAALVAPRPALHPARVLAVHRDRWVVDDGDGALAARLAPRYARRHAPDGPPAVGDWVVLDAPLDATHATIHALLPRTSAFVRRAAGTAVAPQVVAANVDLALVVVALPGDVNVRRIERWTTLAWESGAEPVLVLAKADLADAGARAGAIGAAQGAAPGVRVLALSTVTGDGMDALRALLAPGRTAVLLGASGAGKSTLVNALAGAALLRTGAVRRDGKGRHTTTHRELVVLPGGAALVDTPGMRELQLWSADDGLERAFDDVGALAARCRFNDCAHATEPGCAVRAAVAAGALDGERLESWRRLGRELARLERGLDGHAAAAERARVRALTRAGEAHVRRKRGG